ncbi:MAG: 8-amino-7-oxononanoate synthase [Deltaproteobacteria bacterium]|nr:8-amino-7-oxononanoate synthase [Deltaproteobacteria bacterium]
MKDSIKKELKNLRANSLERTLNETQRTSNVRTTIKNKDALVLCSNDYLGLLNHPRLKSAAIEATKKYGTGSGASRLITGTTPLHTELEKKLKVFTKFNDVLLFNSGYQAKIGAIPALINASGKGTEIFSDKLNHASIIDACILSRTKVWRYQHSDLSILEDKLKESNSKNKLIITESVFSMDGDLASLNDIQFLSKKYNALLYIDDAHGFGVLGKNGRGVIEELNLIKKNTILMATFGKALGSYGAFIAGDSDIIKLLTNKARAFIFSTSLPPAICAATSQALDIIQEEPKRRKRLHSNANLLRDILNTAGLDTLNTSTHIIPVLTGSAKLALQISNALLEDGVFVQAIRPPTVRAGTSRLRLTVSSELSTEDILSAADLIIEKFKELSCAK